MIKNNIYTSLKVYVVFVYCILSQQEQSNTIPFLYKGGINGPKFRFQNITTHLTEGSNMEGFLWKSWRLQARLVA